MSFFYGQIDLMKEVPTHIVVKKQKKKKRGHKRCTYIKSLNSKYTVLDCSFERGKECTAGFIPIEMSLAFRFELHTEMLQKYSDRGEMESTQGP